MPKRAVVTMLCAVFFVLLAPRTARAGGALLIAKDAKDASDANDPRAELPLERTDVDVAVSGSIVGATVTQRFKNDRSTPIEVVYLFPLPAHAAVDAMEMTIGARTVTASIARREEARAVYQAAVKDGRRAALLEQERPNMFTFSVGNIDAGATIDVKLHYFEIAEFDHGTYEIAVPTTVGPRFIPEKGVPDADRITTTYTYHPAPIGIHVKLDGGTAIESVTTPAWETDITRPSPNVADVKSKKNEIPNRDFTLRWRLKAESFEPALFAHKAPGADSGYLTLMLEPKHDIAMTEIAPRELVFLLDTSGSMHGAPLTTAIMAVNKAIDRLGPQDTFQIIDFADTASTFAPRPLPNTPENRKKGHAYVNDLRSAGGTNQLAGIHAALTTPGDESRTRYVVFMTDGYIGNDEEVVALTRKEIGKAHIFSFGVGSSVNRHLLDEVAIAGRGYAEYMRPRTLDHDANADMNELVERFYTRIGLPFLTDIEVDWGPLASSVTDTRPAALPDLSALQPLVLHARYSRPGEGDVTLRGKVGGRPRTQKLHVVLPAEEPSHAEIEKLWARETIAELERATRGRQPNVEAITRVALKHGLLSRYTAFVGTDSTGPKDADGNPVRLHQPSAAPEGVDLDYAGGWLADAKAVSPDHEQTMEVPRTGGCAGCTTARATSARPAALLLLGLAVFLRRRRTASEDMLHR